MKVKYRRLGADGRYHGESYELLRRCSEYFERYEGGTPDKEIVKEILAEVPAGYSPEDKVVLSMEAGGRAAGFIDILKHYPDESTWMIGLLLIDPALRGMGMGGDVHGDIAAMAREAGIKRLRIGVMEENHGGIGFWKGLGYKPLKMAEGEFGGVIRKILVMTLELDNLRARV